MIPGEYSAKFCTGMLLNPFIYHAFLQKKVPLFVYLLLASYIPHSHTPFKNAVSHFNAEMRCLLKLKKRQSVKQEVSTAI